MLTYLLAIAVALGSFAFYMAAFFFPEIHRKYDLIWSGVGMFYALVLWVCAGRITGGVLLGQIASVALIGWFGWQMLELRWAQTPLSARTPVARSTESLGVVVQDESLRLWDYLRSAEFQSRLPGWWQQALQQGADWISSTKGWGNAWVSTTFKSQPPNTPDVDSLFEQLEEPSAPATPPAVNADPTSPEANPQNPQS